MYHHAYCIGCNGRNEIVNEWIKELFTRKFYDTDTGNYEFWENLINVKANHDYETYPGSLDTPTLSEKKMKFNKYCDMVKYELRLTDCELWITSY